MKVLLFSTLGLQLLAVAVLAMEIKSSYTLRGVHSEFFLYTAALIISVGVFLRILTKTQFEQVSEWFLILLFPCAIALFFAIPGAYLGEGCITDYISPSGKNSIFIKERCGILGCYPLHIYKNQFLWGYEIGLIKTSGEPSCALRAKTKIEWKNNETQIDWKIEGIYGTVNVF
ncbi:hypothetical protein V2H45_15545 [Tumidithrix elongata RA019]|uniref:Uncharacterized protein n=1 Tax=Tumidithrix elongata BACA0141 TaxID=2716417 RepID=A0AAW9Q2R1_9CYAN|nr:hypothetical protein [Tumidithrix elongata RA019]